MIRFALFCLSLALMATAPAAQDRSYLGHGRLLTNDTWAAHKDRWRTGSAQFSWVWGAPDQARAGFGDVIELRFGGQIVSPANISRFNPADRPFAGVLSLGVHTHFTALGLENSAGADLVVTGPQTGLDDFQGLIHDVIGASDLNDRTRAQQIGNDEYLRAVLETGRSFDLGARAQLRPFVEGRLGFEDLIRAGVDLNIGDIGGLMLRDEVTGHRYRVAQDAVEGFAFVLGADVAYVDSTPLLPESRGYQLTDERARVRAGVHWGNGQGLGGFYGVTWLGKEFEGQSEEQVIGSLRVQLNF